MRSLDGSVMEFGGPSAACLNVSEGYAPLTRTSDVFGNEVVYTYESPFNGECRLKSVEWGANASAAVSHFARVDLLWYEPSTCNGVAVGSQLDYRTGTKILTGASRLGQVRVTAFPPGQTSAPVHTRMITLEYSSLHMQCDRPHAPVRLLTSIQESAWITGASPVNLPPVTLEYAEPTVTYAATGQGESRPWWSPVPNNLAWGYRYPFGTNKVMDRSPTIEEMFVDLDGDALLDRLYTTSDGAYDGVCKATWQKNLGPSRGSTQPRFGGVQEFTLPRLKWHGQTTNPPWVGPPPAAGGLRAEQSRGEKCSLAGQVTAFWNSEKAGGVCHNGVPGGATCQLASDPNDPSVYCEPFGRECPAMVGDPSPFTYLYYRWMDADGDGLTDLVAAVHGDVRVYDIEQGNYKIGSPPPAEPLLFGPWPNCPRDVERCKDVNPECLGRGLVDWNAIQKCIDDAPTVPCDKLIDSEDGAPSSTNRGPYNRCEGLYPWFIFRNTGSGVFAAPTIKYQPVPLESDSGDSNLAPMTGVISKRHAITDFDGDGVLDAVVKPDPQWGHFFWVWFGDGTGGFEPKRYMFFARPGASMAQSSASPLAHVSTTESIFDLNGDGMLDHWQEVNGQGNASVWFNTGTEHSSSTAITTPYLSGAWSVKPGNDTLHFITDSKDLAPNPPATNPGRIYFAGTTSALNRVFDVDADGRPDVVKDIGTRTPRVFFNLGGQFNAPGVLYPTLYGGTANQQGLKRLTNVVGSENDPRGEWQLLTDHVDLDGDGFPEVVDFESGSYKRAGQLNTEPPRLLTKIHNGRGAHMTVVYASTNDKTVVEQDPASTWTDRWGKQRPNASPRAQWVVKSVAATDDFSGTSSTATHYYKHPRYGADEDGKYAFRGFGEVVTTAPTGSRTIERYGYDVDWTGRLTETLVMPADSEMTIPNEVRSIFRVRWEERTLFGGALRTHHATLSERFTCANEQTEATCKAAPPAYSRTTTTLEALVPDGGAAPLIWQPRSSLLQGGTANANGDRVTTTTFTFKSVGDVYRLRPTVTERRVRNGAAMDLYGKSATTWDPEHKVKLAEQVWFDANRSVTTRYAYDMATGNLTKRWKPKQYAANKFTQYTYDPRKLFITTEVNELGHRVNHTYEYGTGTKLMTEGPNARTCTTGAGCPLDATHPWKEQHKVVVDGLGRTTQTWDTISDDGTLYELVHRSTTSYVDAPNGSTPTYITERVRLDMTSAVWTEERTDLDGHGRPTKVTVSAHGSAAADHVTVYTYRNDGTLSTVQVPDPRQNNAARVTYTYRFDSLGRPISIRRPDGFDPFSDQSGVNFFYNGIYSGSYAETPPSSGDGQRSISTTVTDAFGRVTQVVEGQMLGESHATTYEYGPDDNVRKIVDPEGVTTELTHDLAGHRKEITRHGRTWKYAYDDNGNLAAERVPGSPQPPITDIDYTTTIVYDHLDRPMSKVNGQRSLTAADQALFANRTENFQYDLGGNMVGHLRYWWSYAPNQLTPAIVHSASVNNQGQPVSAIHTMQIAGYPLLERRFGLRYHLFGGVAETHYEDALGGLDKAVSTTHYDARALPSHMVLKRPGLPDQTLAVQTRNVAGLVTKRRTDVTGAMTFVESNWTYDALGRITSQVVQKGPGPVQVARQDLTYTGDDNPKTLTHSLGTTAQQLSFSYDYRHQLKTVASATPGYFNASYNYGPSGRFTRAGEAQTISPAPLGSEIKPRDVNYVYGDADPERVTALTRVSDGSTYAGYAYDATGNMTKRCYGGAAGSSCAGEATEYVYDGKDQLRRATKKIGDVVQSSEEYWYGSTGQRVAIVKRDASGAKTEMIWFIGDVQAHYDATGAITKIYSHLSLGTPVARVERTGNTSTFVEYQFHGLGSSTIAAVAQNGRINTSMSYTPFGDLIEATNAGSTFAGLAAHPRRFNDKYEDQQTGLRYYGARYFDKSLIGWTQADPLYMVAPDAARWSSPRRSNLYQFTLSNPLRYIDPDGLDSKGNWTRGNQAQLDFAMKRQQKGGIYGGGWMGAIEGGESRETSAANPVNCGALEGDCEAVASDGVSFAETIANVFPGATLDDGTQQRPAALPTGGASVADYVANLGGSLANTRGRPPRPNAYSRTPGVQQTNPRGRKAPVMSSPGQTTQSWPTGPTARVNATNSTVRVSGSALATQRQAFNRMKRDLWKAEALVNGSRYTQTQLNNMRQGRAPTGSDGQPMEWHHRLPLANGGTNALSNLEPMTRTEHRLGPNFPLFAHSGDGSSSYLHDA